MIARLHQKINITDSFQTLEKFMQPTRLDTLRRLIDDKFNGNQSDFAKAVGRKPAQINQLLRERRQIGEATASLIEKRLGLPQGFFDDPTINSRSADDPDESTGKIFVLSGEKFVAIAQVKIEAQAGEAGFSVVPMGSDAPAVYLPREWLWESQRQQQDLFALAITDDAMSPSLWPGDLIVFDQAEVTPMDGQVFVINYEGSVLIRRIRRDAGAFWLDADNQNVRTKRLDEAASILGRVIHRQSKRI
jgi:phage repressor protein C with HTH and peptisase S24 domain